MGGLSGRAVGCYTRAIISLVFDASRYYITHFIVAFSGRHMLLSYPMKTLSSHTPTLQSSSSSRRLIYAFEVGLNTTEWTDWAKMPSWTADEAAALTLGLSPQLVRKYPDVHHPIIDRFHRFTNMIARACAANDLANSEYGITPDDYLAWATRYGFDVPAELAAEVTSAQATTPKRTKDKPLGTRERDTLLKMILGMAVAGYGYDPLASKSSTVKEIHDDLIRQGLNLDQDTIRNKLRESTRLLDGHLIDE